jgi:CBS domain-containing membrane protein
MDSRPPDIDARRALWRRFWPAPLAVDGAERLRMVIGALLGIGVTALVCHAMTPTPPLPWLVAPMGASAVLLFCLPSSPLAQPWPVIGGNAVSALVGVACVHLAPHVDVAAALSVALAIGAMLALRCLHPPGGASALLMVLGGVDQPAAALTPVLVNAVVLTGVAWAFHRATRHDYPHAAVVMAPHQVTEQDLEHVLSRYNEVLDISREDLLTLIDRTQRLAHQRRLADTRCADVMTRELTTVEYDTPLHEAWNLLREKKLKTLPVVDRSGVLVGIVTLSDFLDAAATAEPGGLRHQMRRLLRLPTGAARDVHEVVGQIMTRRVRVTREHRTLSDLVQLFSSTGHRHIPVVAGDGKLLGMVTQSGVVAALKVGQALDLPPAGEAVATA